MTGYEFKADRRRFPRARVDRPCKLYDPRARRYYAARTIDLSRGGALIELQAPRAIPAHAEVFLALALNDEPLIPGEDLLAATVTRRGATRDPGSLAIAFRTPIPAKAVADAA